MNIKERINTILLKVMDYSKIDRRIQHRYSREWFMSGRQYDIYVVFYEHNGNFDNRVLDDVRMIDEYCRSINTELLNSWYRHSNSPGWAGETFAITGLVTGGLLAFLSNCPSVKFIYPRI